MMGFFLYIDRNLMHHTVQLGTASWGLASALMSRIP